MHDFGPQELALAQFAEPLDGPFVSGLAEVASRRGVTVVAGMFEAVDGDSTPGLQHGGRGRPGRRADRPLPQAAPVRRARLAGVRAAGRRASPTDRLVFDCGELRVGVMTCYDIRFPELARALSTTARRCSRCRRRGSPDRTRREQFRALATARAIENVCYVAGAVQTPPSYTGQSALIDPFGVVLESLDDDAGERSLTCQRAGCRVPGRSRQHRR